MNPEVNVKISTEAARLLRPKNRECYTNAVTALVQMSLFAEDYPEFRDAVKDCVYVEGFATGFIGPRGHGWIQTGGGEIIEVTPVYLRGDYEYFPALAWSRAQIMVLFGDDDDDLTFPLSGCGGREYEHLEWRQAYRVSGRHAGYSEAVFAGLDASYPEDPDITLEHFRRWYPATIHAALSRPPSK